MEYKERIVYLDLLKICAVAAVVLLHTAASQWYSTPPVSFNWQVMNIYDSLVRWSVPIFVMISGVFQLRPISNQLSCKEEFRLIFKTRILRIIYAIVFWSIIYNGYRLLSRHLIHLEPASWGAILGILLKIIFGPGWYHLWFLYMFIGLCLLTPLVRLFIAHAQKTHLKSFIILSVAIGSGIPLINFILSKLHVIPVYRIYFSIPELSGYLGYYVAGYYFANNDVRKRTRKWFYFMAFVSILFTIGATAYLSIRDSYPEAFLYEYILPTTMFVSFSIFLFFKKVFGSRHFSEKQIRNFAGISGCTMGIYLLHDLVLQVLSLRGLTSVSFNPIISIPVISFGVFIISLIAVSFLKKIPIVAKYIV